MVNLPGAAGFTPSEELVETQHVQEFEAVWSCFVIGSPGMCCGSNQQAQAQGCKTQSKHFQQQVAIVKEASDHVDKTYDICSLYRRCLYVVLRQRGGVLASAQRHISPSWQNRHRCDPLPSCGGFISPSPASFYSTIRSDTIKLAHMRSKLPSVMYSPWISCIPLFQLPL